MLNTHTQMCTDHQMQVQTTSIPILHHKGSSISSYGPQYLLLDRSLLLSLELCPLLWWLRLRLRLLERDLWRWRFSRDLDRVLLFRSRDMERDRCLRCSLDRDLLGFLLWDRDLLSFSLSSLSLSSLLFRRSWFLFSCFSATTLLKDSNSSNKIKWGALFTGPILNKH